ncbi:MAG: hypothetical protein Q8O99_00725 [bacterium]|nr:hypothetical protein [bacterium]
MDNLHISLKAGTQEEYDTAKAKNDPLQASEFLLQENVKKQKETFTVSAKEKSARIQVLQEEQKKETDE